MLNQKLSKSILTIGCNFNKPSGGIAQVLYNYNLLVFPQMKFIANSSEGNKLDKLCKAIFALLTVYFKLQFDKDIKIVHIHTASYNSFKRSYWFIKLAKAMHLKIILHIHGGDFKAYFNSHKKFVSSTLNQCDCIITLSKSWKTFFESITTCKHIYILNNIIELPQIQNSPKHSYKKKLLFLGTITEQKGIFDLLTVLAEHKDFFIGKIHLYIGGNGNINRFRLYKRK